MNDQATETREALRPNREIADQIPMVRGDTSGAALVPQNAGQAMEMAKMMCSGGAGVPKHLRAQPGVCLRIVMDAMQFGLNPFHLASDSYVINDQLAYGAKAIDAMVMLSGLIDGRLDVTYSGQGADLKCMVTGKMRGSKITHTKTARFGDITTKNSPLWKTDPQQQLGYYTKRAWCRLYAPDAIMGLLAKEDPQIIAGPPAEAATAPQSDRERVEQALGAKEVTDADYEVVNGENGETAEPDPPAEAQPTDPYADGVPLIDEQGVVENTRKKPMPWFGDLQTMLANAKDPQALIELNRGGAEHWCREDKRSENLWQQCREDAEQRSREPALGV